MVNEILKKADEIINPYTGKNINYKELINKVNYFEKENKVSLEINKLGDNKDFDMQIKRELIKKIKIDLGLAGVKIDYAKVIRPEERVAPNAKVIAIISGKGGVGKSQVTYNLAKAMVRAGKKVAVVDCDIYGYSIQKISNQYEELTDTDGKANPLIDENGIEMISTQHFIDDNKNEAVVWRGPMLVKMMANFFKYVNFSEDIDYLLIDMPPGTGDVMLNLPNYFREIYTLLITTPDENAAHVALRSGMLAEQLKMKSLGIVENMSFLPLGDERLFVFGQGGSDLVAKELHDDIIAQIPIVNQLQDDFSIMDSAFDDIVGEIEEKTQD